MSILSGLTHLAQVAQELILKRDTLLEKVCKMDIAHAERENSLQKEILQISNEARNSFADEGLIKVQEERDRLRMEVYHLRSLSPCTAYFAKDSSHLRCRTHE